MGIYLGRQLAFAAMLTTVFCLGSVATPNVANATIYYVATTGNDANPGGQSQPFRTIEKGVSVLKPGDTLYIRQGTYTESISPLSINIPSGTSWSNAITIAGYPGEAVTLANGISIQDNVDASIISYLIFDNLIVRNGTGNAINVAGNSHHIRFTNSDMQSTLTNTILITHTTSYIEVLNSRVHDSPVEYVPAWGASTGTYGFYIGGSHMLVEGNTIYNNTGYGISLYASGQSNVNNNIIRNNILYGNAYDDGTRGSSVAAVVLSCGSDNQFYNNTVYNNAHTGVQVSYSGTNNQVYNNTIYNNNGSGIEVFDSAPSTVLKNNIVFANGGGAANQQIVDYGATGTVQSNNLTTDPKFVDASAHNFSLQAGSPAIDAGVTVSVVTTDIKGVVRPQGVSYDIGAYEHYKGTTPFLAPNNLRRVSP